MSGRVFCRCAIIGLLTAVLGVSVPEAAADTVFESFENGLGPWRAEADTRRDWFIHRNEDQAQHGTFAMEFTADGLSDDGTLWMVREILLPPGNWNVGLQYFVWSEFSGDVGLWTALGFIGNFEPQTETDFTQTSAGQDLGGIGTAGWSSRSMSRTFNVGAPTTIYVAFGYNIVFEVPRTHYFDAVSITGVPLQCGDGTCLGGEDGCNCPGECPAPPGSELTCDDGRDDDCDTAIDCFDADCSTDPACAGIICNGDGVCDGAAGETSCVCNVDCGLDFLQPEADCQNGLDDDCDALADCDDPDCSLDPDCGGTGCDGDGVCEADEDCTNCLIDCFSAPGAACGNGVCEAGNGEDCLNCPADCKGKQGGNPSQRYCCGDGSGQNPVPCSDPRCTAGGVGCTASPVAPSCCGDGNCTGSENQANCAIDCAPTCSFPADCDDDNACTVDACAGGMCSNDPLNCSDGNACTTDSCHVLTGCQHSPVNCNDGNACTADSCNASSGCQHSFPPCGPADSCCSPGCGAASDPDCGPPCAAPGQPCTQNSNCCSGLCKGNGTCK
jgi:hypothetical protein